MKNKITNIIIPTLKVVWKVIRPKLIEIGAELIKETYKYFKNATPEKIEEAYNQVKAFEEELRRNPNEKEELINRLYK